MSQFSIRNPVTFIFVYIRVSIYIHIITRDTPICISINKETSRLMRKCSSRGCKISRRPQYYYIYIHHIHEEGPNYLDSNDRRALCPRDMVHIPLQEYCCTLFLFIRAHPAHVHKCYIIYFMNCGGGGAVVSGGICGG